MKKTFKDLKRYCKNITSVYGENGILSAILKKLGIHSGNLIEFGAANGKYLSNTYHLLESGKWKCLYIEPHDRYTELEKLNDIFGDKIITLKMAVHTRRMREYKSGTTLDEIIEKYMPEPDVISIDIDSYDYYIFQELQYKPKIIIIEINAVFNPDVEYIDRQRPNIFGTSFLSMVKLGKEKGYEPIIHIGCNIFFIRKDICEEFEIPEIKFDNTIQKEYNEIIKS